jgi:hypothetical protein
MPDGARHECRHPRCPNYTVADGYCTDHQRHDRKQLAGRPVANGPKRPKARFPMSGRMVRFQKLIGNKHIRKRREADE